MYWVFLSFLTVMSGLVIYGAYKNYRRSLQLILVRRTLTEALQIVGTEIVKNENLLARAKALIAPGRTMPDDEDFSSPAFLSTVIGALIIKHGTVRLSLQDVLKVGDDYVSVYVDGQTQELILSMNHNLDTEDPLSMIGFPISDDKIFH
tara:strand:+ start:84 stop:530 length:447 start_codon:yes stop_codon:yes gene_type:complete